MKVLKVKEILFLITPLAFISMFLVRARYLALNSDSITLVGFPYPYRSEAIASSFQYEWYIRGFLINLAFYGVIWYSIFSIFWYRIKSKMIKNIMYTLIWLVFISLFLLYFTEDQSFFWDFDFPNEYLGEIEFFY